MKIYPYLNFAGNTAEALQFYRSVFGGELSGLMHFKDMPPSEQPMPASEGDKVMHVSLPIGTDSAIMASDISEAMGQKLIVGNNVYIMLEPDSLPEAERLYAALSAGGVVEMPLAKMFWGDYYASFADKFGVQWMIDLAAH